MNFLVDLLKRFRHWRASSRSESPDGPLVTRFIFSKTLRWNDTDGFRLKPTAFLPRRSSGSPWALSVFRIDNLVNAEIWQLARSYVLPEGRNIHGRADLIPADIERTDPPLWIDFDEDPPRHANVCGWPEAQDEQLAVAQDLVLRARHHPPSE